MGSTSVAGLAAKPIIDMSVIVASKCLVLPTVARLSTLGYVHLGDKGIKDCEAFRLLPELPAHHLYACPHNSLALEQLAEIEQANRKK